MAMKSLKGAIKKMQEKNKTDKLEEYSRLLDSIAWYRQGDIFELAKLAKSLGRNYTQDLAERKQALEKEKSK